MLTIQLIRNSAMTLVAAIGFAAAVQAADPAPTTKPAPYPLKTCVVSGEKLGEMGEPKVITYEGREIQFCCPSCEKDFKKDPAKFVKLIDAAAKGTPATQPTSKPTGQGAHQG